MRIFLSIAIALCIILTCFTANATSVNYSLWASVLSAYVNDQGRVDYAALKSNSADFDAFIHIIETTDVAALPAVDQKAFWINAYNALTLKLIVDNYPLKFGGIRTINWGRPWSVDMDVAGQKLTLGYIEHEILRKLDPMDPRVHFAINCASIGCPVLSNKPFYPETLDMQLDTEARKFINNPQKVRIDYDKEVLYYSAIFKWFAGDFTKDRGTIETYIGKYINEEDRKFLVRTKVKLKTLDYDWGLNAQ